MGKMTDKTASEFNGSIKNLFGVAIGAVSFALTLGLIIWQTGDNASKADKTISDSFNSSLAAVKQDLAELKMHGKDGHPHIVLISLKGLERRLALIETWKELHDNRNAGVNSAQWERIFAIEREIFGTIRSNSSPGRAEGVE